MNSLVIERLKTYSIMTSQQEKEALREIIQEIALLGLWRGKFFEHAAFYGGTALRILYNLDRFSEDLDFTALLPAPRLRFESYLGAVQTELKAYGFEVTVESKKKDVGATVDSAFIKADTAYHLLTIGSKHKAHPGELLKVKFEMDVDPALGFTTDVKSFFWPQPFTVLTCDLPSLLAGKLHATFCRKRVKNVKGRDWYDLLWYVSRGIKPNYKYLENKLHQSGHWPKSDVFTPQKFKQWAKQQVANLDIEAAKKDVQRFILDQRKIEGWSTQVFLDAIERF